MNRWDEDRSGEDYTKPSGKRLQAKVSKQLLKFGPLAKRIPKRMNTNRGQRKFPLTIRFLQVLERGIIVAQTEMDHGQGSLWHEMILRHIW